MQKTQEMQIQSLGGEDPLEEEMATHPSILAWEIPWTEEPGGLQSMRSQSQTQLSTHTSKPWHDLKENKCYWRYMCFSPQIIFVTVTSCLPRAQADTGTYLRSLSVGWFSGVTY